MADLSDKWLVSTDWLQDHLQTQDLVVLDATWHMPNSSRNAFEEYRQEHIPGAIFFDINKIVDDETSLPHMLPTAEKFSSFMGEMGISDDARIIVYDSHGIMSAPRVWWTLRTMGASNVSVLNGGLKKWKSEERPLQSTVPAPPSGKAFSARLDQALVSDRHDVLQAIEAHSVQIVDARAAARFSGQAPEPRADLRPGHMPGALNVPFGELILEDGTMKNACELEAELTSAGINLSKPIITTCGSGITASIVALALAITGHDQFSVYDGSWSEWGAAQEASTLPVITD